MSQAPPLSLLLLLIILTLFFSATTTTTAHNITRILAKHPDFSTFNHYLTVTHLAADINRRQTITVLALDNAACSSLLSKGFSLYTIRNILSLHVLVDYYGAKKLHQISGGSTKTSSMFQASGSAPGTSGYVNITDFKGGKVGFGTEDTETFGSFYVKSILEKPYNISILQISQVLTSGEAEAPTAGPSEINLTTILANQGCKAFSDLLISTGAAKAFQDSIDGGLTVFCPPDTVLKKFMPKYNNLTASNKTSLLLYHGIPVYQPIQTLKSENGAINTLATDNLNKYDFTVQNDGEVVTLETTVVTAKITATLKELEPLIVYKIDKVLLPRELYKPVLSTKPDKATADGPSAEGPADDSDDQTADKNGVVRLIDGGRLIMVALSLCVGVFFM